MLVTNCQWVVERFEEAHEHVILTEYVLISLWVKYFLLLLVPAIGRRVVRIVFPTPPASIHSEGKVAGVPADIVVRLCIFVYKSMLGIVCEETLLHDKGADHDSIEEPFMRVVNERIHANNDYKCVAEKCTI